MDEKWKASYLYYNINSPVQYGSFTQIKDYITKNLKKTQKPLFIKSMQTLKEFRKEIEMGTHTRKKMKKLGDYHYSLIPYKDGYFQADLMDVYGKTNTLKENDNYKWILIFINAQTKFIYFRKLKSKHGIEVAKAINDILENDLDLKNNPVDYTIQLQTDKGSEFFNKHVETVLKNNNVHLYASNSKHKAAIAERAISTIRQYLVKAMEDKGPQWISLIKNVVDKYNNRFHLSIQMSPIKAKNNFITALTNLHKTIFKTQKIVKTKNFNIGDIVRVRVRYPRTALEKGSLRIWSATLYMIRQKRLLHNKYIYHVNTYPGDKKIHETYDNNTLLLGKTQEEYRYIPTGETRTRNKQKE